MHRSLLPGCTSWVGHCGAVASSIRLLLALALTRHKAHIPNATLDNRSHAQCNLLIVGDSHALQLYDSAISSLLDSGATVLHHVGHTTSHRLSSWVSGAQALKAIDLTAEVAHKSSPATTSDQTNESFASSVDARVEPVVHAPTSLLTLPEVPHVTNGTHAALVQLMFLDRNGMSEGRDDVILSGRLQQLVHALGSCTLVLYGEGAHSAHMPAPLFSAAVRSALDELSTFSSRRGPVALTWEMAAQHFRTADRSGVYEHFTGHHKVLKSLHDTTAPSNATAAWYVRRHKTTLAQVSMFSANQVRWGECEANTSPNYTDWRNERLKQEAAQMRPPIPVLPFWNYSRAWGATLHTFKGDCSHVCYTPYFHMPIWHGMQQVLREMRSAAGPWSQNALSSGLHALQ